jgi:hypothetical protein
MFSIDAFIFNLDKLKKFLLNYYLKKTTEKPILKQEFMENS